MLFRLILKAIIVISIGLIQSTGVYTITPPQTLTVFGHALFPISLFLLFSPEIIEISDIKNAVNEIPLRIFSFIVTAISVFPIIFIKKFIILETNHLDSIPLKFGFTLFRVWSPEEKLNFLESTLEGIGLNNHIPPAQKLQLVQQSSTMSDLHTNLLNFIQQQHEVAAQVNKSGFLEFFVANHFYVSIALIALGVYLVYINQVLVWKMYADVRSVNENYNQMNNSLGMTNLVVARNQQVMLDLENACEQIKNLALSNTEALENLSYLSTLTPEDIKALKILLDNMAKGVINLYGSTNPPSPNDIPKGPDITQ